MAKQEIEEVTHKTVQTGGVLVKIYFDMQSEEKDQLQPLMADFVNNSILKFPGVVYCFGTIDEPIAVDKGYSTTSTLTVLFKDLGSLIGLVFRYTPAGVEILKPEKDYVLKIPVLQSMLLDVANISLEYSKYIMSKVMKEEDYQKVLDDIKKREELGKKLLEKKDGQK